MIYSSTVAMFFAVITVGCAVLLEQQQSVIASAARRGMSALDFPLHVHVYV